MALLPMIYALTYSGNELNNLDMLAAFLAIAAVIIKLFLISKCIILERIFLSLKL
jgi:hypothetical protein